MIFYRELEYQNYNKYKKRKRSQIKLTDLESFNFPAERNNNLKLP